MDSQNLSAFEAVARLESFSDAAEQLHLTQPAVSKRIATLEQQLNCKLFDRIGRQVQLTEAGRLLQPKARQILQALTDTKRDIDELQGTVAGKLSLATSHYVGLHHLPSLLKRYCDKYPDVVLDLNFLDSEKAHQAITYGDYDLAVVTLSDQANRDSYSKGIIAQNLWQEPLLFVAAREHPLSKKNNLKLSDLSPYSAILPDYSTYTSSLIKELFDRSGTALSINMATNHLDAIKMMVSIGLGWGVLPESMVDSSLSQLNISNASLTRQLGYIHQRDRSLSNAARAFIDELNSEQQQHNLSQPQQDTKRLNRP